MSQQAIGFHYREINRRMAERGMPAAAWSPEKVAYQARQQLDEASQAIDMLTVESAIWREQYRACFRSRQDVVNEAATLRAELAKVDESPYSPAFLRAISATCSTPASRAGKTQDEVFKEEGK